MSFIPVVACSSAPVAEDQICSSGSKLAFITDMVVAFLASAIAVTAILNAQGIIQVGLFNSIGSEISYILLGCAAALFIVDLAGLAVKASQKEQKSEPKTSPELEALKTQMGELQTKVQSVTEEGIKKDQKIEELTTTVNGLKSQITTLRTSLFDRDREIENLTKRDKEKEQQLKAKEQQLVDYKKKKDKEISMLKSNASQQISQLSDQTAALKQALEGLTARTPVMQTRSRAISNPHLSPVKEVVTPPDSAATTPVKDSRTRSLSNPILTPIRKDLDDRKFEGFQLSRLDLVNLAPESKANIEKITQISLEDLQRITQRVKIMLGDGFVSDEQPLNQLKAYLSKIRDADANLLKSMFKPVNPTPKKTPFKTGRDRQQ